MSLVPVLIAASPALVALVLWAIADLERFVLFAVLASMVYPASLAKPGGANVAIVDLLLVLALASWIVNSAMRNAPSPWLRGNSFLIPALLFVAVNTASLVWSIKPKSTAIFSIQLIELIVLFPILFASIPTSIDRIRRAFLTFVFVSSIVATATFLSFLAHPSAAAQGTYLPGLNKNAIGSFVGAGAIIAYTLTPTARRGVPRWLLIIAFGVNVAGLIGSGSRGAELGAAAGILVVSAFAGRRMLALILLVAMVGLTVTVVLPNTAKQQTVNGAYDSSLVRKYAWEGAVKKIEAHPVLGTGGKTYLDELPQFTNYFVNDPNNLFLLTWAELGIPGMAALIFMLVRYGQIFAKARRQRKPYSLLTIAAGGATVSLLVHFQVDTAWARGATTLAWAMVGVMLAVERLYRRDRAREVETEERSVSEREPALPAAA